MNKGGFAVDNAESGMSVFVVHLSASKATEFGYKLLQYNTEVCSDIPANDDYINFSSRKAILLYSQRSLIYRVLFLLILVNVTVLP